jgi:hypothetical protein
MIAVEAVTFNHDPGAATHDALNIRRNASQTVHIPEWRRFISVNPEDSPAAYALDPTKGNPLTILVSLRSTDPGLAFVEVRVERHVAARAVNFVNGATGPVAFTLESAALPHHVGIRDVTWHWEFRLGPHHEWHRFDTTRHRLYSVLAVPTAPWQQAPPVRNCLGSMSWTTPAAGPRAPHQPIWRRRWSRRASTRWARPS